MGCAPKISENVLQTCTCIKNNWNTYALIITPPNPVFHEGRLTAAHSIDQAILTVKYRGLTDQLGGTKHTQPWVSENAYKTGI